MRDYVIFVDTETSGLPKDWNKPYSAEKNWPFIVQIAWTVCTKDGNEIKYENHYIEDKDYEILEASRQIHGISHEFLQRHGKERREVMQRLLADLKKYNPLVVSHFIPLDYHMLGVGFFRAGLENPLQYMPKFCTMQLTYQFVGSPHQKFLRLGQLYTRLFQTTLENQHNALVDARATARCFFELQKRGDITDKIITKQQEKGSKWLALNKGVGIVIMLLVILSLFMYHYV
ncbi:3'-5' exonuclease [Rapidithrix thailandica]|uniref:3'-5' exonuclease n=1 Tax=Rapidithrix thailandica TaxID=413964 RepID=A0AAW9S9H7_9BACT